MNTPETRKPLFFQQDFQNALSSVKSFEGGTSFSSQTTFFMLKSTMKSRGYALTKWKFREEAQSRKNWNDVFSTVNKKFHQFHMIKRNKEVTRKTWETYFFHRKPQKLKIAKKNIFRKLLSKKNEKFHSVSRIVSKVRKLATYRRITKRKVFPSKLGKDESKLSFLRTS